MHIKSQCHPRLKPLFIGENGIEDLTSVLGLKDFGLGSGSQFTSSMESSAPASRSSCLITFCAPVAQSQSTCSKPKPWPWIEQTLMIIVALFAFRLQWQTCRWQSFCWHTCICNWGNRGPHDSILYGWLPQSNLQSFSHFFALPPGEVLERTLQASMLFVSPSISISKHKVTFSPRRRSFAVIWDKACAAHAQFNFTAFSAISKPASRRNARFMPCWTSGLLVNSCRKKPLVVKQGTTIPASIMALAPRQLHYCQVKQLQQMPEHFDYYQKILAVAYPFQMRN